MAAPSFCGPSALVSLRASFYERLETSETETRAAVLGTIVTGW